jgi:hypothetical protein
VRRGVLLSAEGVIDANSADILSLSYGEYEGSSGPDIALANDLWEQAASQGQTVVVSAGDTGPAVEDDGPGITVASHGITVSGFRPVENYRFRREMLCEDTVETSGVLRW